MKNNCCLFERLFKVKKIGLFLVGIYFLLEYDTNEENDGVIAVFTKRVQHSIMNISRIIRAVFCKLVTRNVHYERNMAPTMPLP